MSINCLIICIMIFYFLSSSIRFYQGIFSVFILPVNCGTKDEKEFKKFALSEGKKYAIRFVLLMFVYYFLSIMFPDLFLKAFMVILCN